MTRLLVIPAFLTAWSVIAAEPPRLGFRPSAEKSYYEFDTGACRGKMRLDGKSQGICSLVHLASGMELAKPPGLLSYYRVFTTNKRFDDAARNWPAVAKLLPDGGLQVAFPPDKEHPLEIRGVFRCTQPDTIDLETTVVPQDDLPQFELFLSNYVAQSLEGSAYVKPTRYSKNEPPSLLRADWSPLIDGDYLIFPRDLEAIRLIHDGRWEYAPSPVQWVAPRYMAGPLAVRRDQASGLSVALMAPPGDCFAVAMPYNKTPPDGVAGHSSFYLSLFGRDLPAGKAAQARCRIVIRKDLTDKDAIALFEAYCTSSGKA